MVRSVHPKMAQRSSQKLDFPPTDPEGVGGAVELGGGVCGMPLRPPFQTNLSDGDRRGGCLGAAGWAAVLGALDKGGCTRRLGGGGSPLWTGGVWSAPPRSTGRPPGRAHQPPPLRT